MTFDTWWKEYGSLHPTIFSLSFEQRENYRIVAETAWNYPKKELEELELTHERELGKYEERLDSKQEEIDRLESILTEIKDLCP